MTNTLPSPKNYLLKNYDILNKKNLPTNDFNKIFYTLRKNLHVKKSRKYKVDSLLKKAKCKFFQVIHKIMKYSLSIKVKRLPQLFITNITIEYNRYYLEKTVFQIYKEFKLIKSIQKINDEIIKIKKKELLKTFSKYKLNELYNVYIDSQCYQKDLKEIIKKNGKNIGILYEFVSKNLIFYYKYNKSKVPRKETKESGYLSDESIERNIKEINLKKGKEETEFGEIENENI